MLSLSALKPSEFNVLIRETSDTPPLLFNSNSRHLLALDPEDLTTLNSLWSGNCLEHTTAIEAHLGVLVSQGFIVSQERDERSEVLEGLDALTKDNGLATLTIMTTLQCNLGCGYCFQKRESSYYQWIQRGPLSIATASCPRHTRVCSSRGSVVNRF